MSAVGSTLWCWQRVTEPAGISQRIKDVRDHVLGLPHKEEVSAWLPEFLDGTLQV